MMKMQIEMVRVKVNFFRRFGRRNVDKHRNFGDGSGLRALFVDENCRTMIRPADLELRAVDDVRKLRVARESFANAQLHEILREERLEVERDFRQANENFPVKGGRLVERVKKTFAVSRRLVAPQFGCVQRLFVDGHNHEHCRARRVRQLNTAEFFVGEISDLFAKRRVHHENLRRRAVVIREIVRVGAAFVERKLPRALEVNDIEQLRLRVFVDNRPVILNQARSFFGNETRKFLTFTVNVARKVERAHVGIVIVRHNAAKLFVEPACGGFFVDGQQVHRTENIFVAVTFTDRRVKILVCLVERGDVVNCKHAQNLCLSFARRTVCQHAKRGVNSVGRKDRVVVDVERVEKFVAEFVDACRQLSTLRAGDVRQTQQREHRRQEDFHGDHLRKFSSP